MKRRLVSVLLLAALLFGCAGQSAPQNTETVPPEPEGTPIVEAVPLQTPVDITVDAATPTPHTPPPPPTPTPSPTPEPPLYGITIGIDPGHQARPNFGTEPVAPDSDEQKVKCSSGTIGIASDVPEYQVNLDVALKLAALLEADGATVILTRTVNDVNLSNRERAEIMNEHEVDLAIRLHCNGADDTGIRGAFMLVPTREHTQSFAENVRAAQEVIDAYCAATGLGLRKNAAILYRDDQTGFNWCKRPIICIEMGHLSNETEDLLLTNAAFQDKMAFGIYMGIIGYFHPEKTD
ncbi:MAG: N-acetylmuramoyl-L-alanine amidase [Clostridia bacterium]|jgi:N-acetylmuramoyl-L-alanine amidase|nr:N-acetylmuramoyl-L-alanine amidase [Clostridia bacterium]MBR3038156.1 N-acetylmuramoyl-L-alanine amidase [Clostridia bacterium]MBR3128987.1 N-acetylmuramoyl-L-alanine amidase [Clostridia bacterium]